MRVGRISKFKVTRKDLKEALIQLFTPEGNNIPDTALFYFSGHGLRETSGRLHEGYLATSDANPDEDNYGLSLRWLRRLLEESPIRQQIIWLDCCYSGELLNFAADPGDRGKGRDRCFIAASRENANLDCFVMLAQKICTDFRNIKNLTPEQVKSARAWQYAMYDKDFRKKLGLPLEK